MSFFTDILFLFRRRDLFRFFLLLCLLIIGTFVEIISLAVVPVFAGIITQNPDSLSCLARVVSFVGVELEQANFLCQVRWASALLIAIFGFRALYLYFSCYLQQRILKNRCIELGSRLFASYMSAPYSFILQSKTQDLVNTVVVEAERLLTYVIGGAINVLRCITIMATIIVLLLIYTPQITLFSLICLGIFCGGFLWWNRKKNKEQGEEETLNRKSAMAIISESLTGFKEIQIAGCKLFFQERLHTFLERYFANKRWLEVNQVVIWPYLEFATVAVMVVSTLLALSIAGEDFSTVVPTLAFFAVALFRLKGYVTDAVLSFSLCRYHTASVNVVCQDLRKLQKMGANKECNSVNPLSFQREISVENLSFTYASSPAPVLRNISLKIQKGTSVAFVGATGSGKSTLLDLILGIHPPNNGKILVDGQDIRNNIAGWQRLIGYVPQQIFLLDDTIRANIAFGIPENEIDEERVKKALWAAQLQDFIKELPEGLEALIGERGIRISGGQRQRIAVARALYRNPPILVFDEATSALDNDTEKALTEAIDALRGEHTILIVAHRLTTIENADKIYKLDGGMLTEK